MSIKSNYYDLYITSVLTLARTIIIKSKEAIDGLNKYVTEQAMLGNCSELNTLEPTTWKYYMNISGEYNQLDTMMTVVSLDTLEIINFTKYNLEIHLATKAGYSYGSRNYNELLNRYPDQELLIKGILYPTDINIAIDSEDGTILEYPSGLVEENEYSLISKLQDWVYKFKQRWVNVQYSNSDCLYPATMMGIMYLNLVPCIITLRAEACKTNEAHSFHVKQYLASHGFLNYYLDNMTRKQALFFYRNIKYIERNAGKRDTFNWLVEHVITERNLPLAQYKMKHKLSKMPGELHPTPIFRKSSINGLTSANKQTEYSLSELLNKELDLARDNDIYNPIYKPLILEKMENSVSNTELTKALESSVIDYSNSSQYSLEDILLNHWIYLCSKNLYKSYITVINPNTNEKITVTAKDAFILYFYCYWKVNGKELIYIPNILANRVQRIVTNTNTLNNFVQPETLFDVANRKIVSLDTAKQLVSLQPNITTIISTKAFYTLCENIYKSTLLQSRLTAYQENMKARAMVSTMANYVYCDTYCSLGNDGDKYVGWFNSRNIDISTLTQDELIDLYTSILKETTNISLNSNSALKDLQKAMLGLLTQLSSYSIQILGEINNSDIRTTNWPLIRLDEPKSTISAEFKITDLAVNVINYNSDGKNSTYIDLGNNGVLGYYNQYANSNEKVDLGINYTLDGKATFQHRILNLEGVRFKPVIPLTTNNLDMSPVIGINTYLSLTLDQQQTVKDIYGNNIKQPPIDNSGEINDELERSLYQKNRYIVPGYDDPIQ